MRYFFLTVIAAATFVASTSSYASRQYVITPSASQPQSQLQSSDVETLGPNRWLILPLFHGHPVKRFNSLSEVIHEAEDRREADPATLQR
jgi:hypothetical protein